jgi:predicted RNase H-like HicB family nuclease
VETELEADGRWIAEVLDLPGVMAYGSTEKEAVASAQALALRVLADRIEEKKEPAETVTVSIEAA